MVLLAACTGPARTSRDYRLKARHSAKAASSAVATSQLVARLVRDRAAFSNYVAVVLDSAERDATSVEATFSSIQSPNRASDHLRGALDSVLNDVVSTISSMRIAARRHDWSILTRESERLPQLEHSLRRYEALGT
ncbi:MAG TPA: hypothetical protein VL769_04075 [Acidimicrobiia bacterium]|nr:hypothetical protein [Acidimicrobiia bacterium]